MDHNITDDETTEQPVVNASNPANIIGEITPFTPYNTPDSPIMFPVGLRQVAWQTRAGQYENLAGHKALIRLSPDAKSASVLAVVSDSYRIVHNRELICRVEDTLMKELPERALKDVRVTDKVAYNGRVCYREYVFPGLCSDIGAKSQIAFRIIIQNGYGGSAIRILAGAIEFWCSNGCVRGEYDAIYRRHTSGLVIEHLDTTVARSINTYVKATHEWRKWTKQPIAHEAAMELFRAIAHTPSQLEKFTDRWMTEQEDRGRNLWAAYSTLTYYASHNEGQFAVRRESANASAIMMQRELNVAKWIERPEFRALVPA